MERDALSDHEIRNSWTGGTIAQKGKGATRDGCEIVYGQSGVDKGG